MKLHLLFAASGVLCALMVPRLTSTEEVNLAEFNEFELMAEEIDFSNDSKVKELRFIFPSDDSTDAVSERLYKGVHSAGHFTWTAVDGRKPEIIKHLGTTSEMRKRLYRQNRYVTRRQFVYIAPSFDKVIQQVHRGERSQITLPGFDGEQLRVTLNQVEDEPHLNRSVWRGHLTGNPNAPVEASVNGSDLRIGIQLSDDVLVRYEPRNPGEWIINEDDLKAFHGHQHKAQKVINGVLAAQ